MRGLSPGRRRQSSTLRGRGGRTPSCQIVATEGPELCAPCGRCRQQLAEFARPDVPVHLAGPEGVRASVTLGQLLPLAFGPETLGPLRPGDRSVAT